MKSFSNAITIFVFFAIISMFSVSMILFGDHSEIYSNIKNPESVQTAVSEYTSENFPMSGNFKSLYASISVLSGKEQFDNIYILQDKLVKVNEYSREQSVNNVELINKFASTVKPIVYVMTIPTAAGVYSAELPAYAGSLDEKNLIDQIYMELDKNVSTIDAYYPLYSARDEYVYYRTEDMWTSFGAYCVYEEAVKKLGYEPVTMNNYDQEYAVSSFSGELYEKVRYSGILPDRINLFRSKYHSPVTSVELTDDENTLNAKSVYFKSALNTNKKTDIFLQGDRFKTINIKTSAEDAPKLLIIKGSYANTFVPFLTPHYSEITLVDPQRLKESGEVLSDRISLNDYDQILVLYDVCGFSTADCFDVLK